VRAAAGVVREVVAGVERVGATVHLDTVWHTALVGVGEVGVGFTGVEAAVGVHVLTRTTDVSDTARTVAEPVTVGVGVQRIGGVGAQQLGGIVDTVAIGVGAGRVGFARIDDTVAVEVFASTTDAAHCDATIADTVAIGVGQCRVGAEHGLDVV